MKRTSAVIGIVTATVAATVAVTGTPAQASTTPRCGNTSLSYGLSRTDGFAGHSAFVLEFRNRGRTSCTLYGYPGLDASASNGTALAHARRTLLGSAGGSRRGLQVVTLAPGGYASATVEWANFNPATSGPCRHSAGVHETAPNTTRTVNQRRSVTVCSLQVHPTVAGWTGQS